jgi:hypothetical protein
LTDDISVIENADKIILPGVGAFPSAMRMLENKNLIPVLKEQAQKKPLLGICLGMQMLLSKSYEFEECDGSAALGEGVKIGQQVRKTFAFCYRTKVGNDLDPEAGFKLHIIYGASAAPSERAYATVNDSPEAITFSWEISTVPVEVEGHKPTAHVEILSTCAKYALIEAALTGTDDQTQITAISAKISGFTGKPMLLLPADLIALLSE